MNFYTKLPSIKTRNKKRVGRGYGSGVGGHTATRGQKGQRSRGKIPLWFEGGQLPLIKRLPMLRGKGRLKSLSTVVSIPLHALENITASEITVNVLKEAKVIHRSVKQVKLLSGKLTKKVTVKGLLVSETAKSQIEKIGGSVLE